MKDFTKRIYNIVKHMWFTRNSNAYINYLRKNGISIGEHCKAMQPETIQIDLSRPELIKIGNHVFLHRGTIIMAHDWASWCFVEKYNDFVPSHKRITIGNNVWLGEYVTILAGVSIGDNVVIGINSVVTKDIPSNSIAVGNPAKVVGSLEDYYQKRKHKYTEECKEYAKAIIESGRKPKPEDFYDDYPTFVDGRNYRKYKYPYNRVFNDEQLEYWIKQHKAPYSSFEDFINSIYKKNGNA